MSRFLRKITFWRAVAAVVVAVGLYATLVRFTQGLGAATNLSDEFPWGLWIGFDLLVGVGLAAGGFAITATVHIFHLKRFEPIVRPTVLTAFLGYLLVIAAVLLDIGRPYRIWHPIVMWNPTSAMFAIAWCEMLYAAVLALEFSPALLERLNLKRPLKVVNAIIVPVTVVAVLLSTVHQSFLGTLYVVVPQKLYGLWYSSLLPVFFFMTAIAAGLSMVILESFMSARAFKRNLEADLLRDLTPVIVVILSVYLVMKVQDMAGRGAFSLLAVWGPETFLFMVEMFFGTLAPIVLFLTPAVRRDRVGLFSSALLVVLGFMLNRLNVSITGMQGSVAASYFPSVMEIAITGMLVAVGFIAFGLAVKYLHIFPKGEPEAPPEPVRTAKVPARLAAPGVVLSLAAVLVVGLLNLDFGVKKSKAKVSRTPAVKAAKKVPKPRSAPNMELKLPGGKELPKSALSPGTVTFNHASHVDEEKPMCSNCHARRYSILRNPRRQFYPFRRRDWHSQAYCGACHTKNKAFDLSDKENCGNCHSEDDKKGDK